MSVSPTNPFVMPGLGQTGEQAANPLLASMEMMRQAFAGLSGAGGFSGGMPMTPSMNPEDLEKRIAELKTVENWLKLNLSMLSSTIQGMEVQLATIVTLRSFANSMSHAQEAGTQGPSALEVILGMRPQTRTGQTSTVPQGEDLGAAAAAPAPAASSASTSQPEAPPDSGLHSSKVETDVPAAAKAWWDMLQKQFGHVAAATAATMASGMGKKTKPATSTKKTTVARAVKKTSVGSSGRKTTIKK